MLRRALLRSVARAIHASVCPAWTIAAPPATVAAPSAIWLLCTYHQLLCTHHQRWTVAAPPEIAHFTNPHGIDAPAAHARISQPSLQSSHPHSHTLVGGSFMRAGSITYEGGSGPQYALRNCRQQVTIGRTQLDSHNRDCKCQKRVRSRAARVQRGLQTAGRHEVKNEPYTPNAQDNIFKNATQPIRCAYSRERVGISPPSACRPRRGRPQPGSRRRRRSHTVSERRQGAAPFAQAAPQPSLRATWHHCRAQIERACAEEERQHSETGDQTVHANQHKQPKG